MIDSGPIIMVDMPGFTARASKGARAASGCEEAPKRRMFATWPKKEVRSSLTLLKLAILQSNNNGS